MKKILIALALGALAFSCKSTADVADTSSDPCGDGGCNMEMKGDCDQAASSCCSSEKPEVCPVTGKEK